MSQATTRYETRRPLLEEAADALAFCEAVNLDGFLGWGRTVKLTPEARKALIEACGLEIEELRLAMEETRRNVSAAYQKEAARAD